MGTTTEVTKQDFFLLRSNCSDCSLSYGRCLVGREASQAVVVMHAQSVLEVEQANARHAAVVGHDEGVDALLQADELCDRVQMVHLGQVELTDVLALVGLEQLVHHLLPRDVLGASQARLDLARLHVEHGSRGNARGPHRTLGRHEAHLVDFGQAQLLDQRRRQRALIRRRLNCHTNRSGCRLLRLT